MTGRIRDVAGPQRSVIPAAQKVTPRNTERSPLRINQSQPTVNASATASAVQENSGTWPGSSFAKLREMVGGNPVIIANQPNHMSAPSRPELMAPNHASALAAPRRKLGTPAPARSASGTSSGNA